PGDLDPRWEQASRRSRRDASEALGEPDEGAALGAFVCALREAFEEVGFVIGDGPLDRLARSDADDPAALLERCLKTGVVLGTDLLVPAGRWVTPEGSPVRFDARFFCARAPREWEPDPDPHEVAGCRWSTARASLADLAAGRLLMAPPTIEMLQRIENLADVAAVLRSTTNTHWQSSGEILKVRLSPEVGVVLAPNPGPLTGPGTNTYVVGSAGPKTVVDPAVSDTAYLDALFTLAGAIDCVVVTHRHPDHVGGVEAVVERSGARVRAFGDRAAGGVPVEPLEEGGTLLAGGMRLDVMHTPGHASDHIVLFDRASGSLFAGDNVLGEGTAVIAPPDGDMGDYLSTLRRLRSLPATRIYPGHFRPLDDPAAILDYYLDHRAERRAAVLEALLRPASIGDIVTTVYADTPAELRPVAALQVQAMLELLEREHQVNRVNDVWTRSDVD
ncbi:MAG: MBL fold metallo-hydrolase, partial [Actinomycetota bacterium]